MNNFGKQHNEIYDSTRMEKHFEGDHDLMKVFTEEYLRQSIKMCNQIRSAIVAQSAEDVSWHAHTLYGAVANFYALSIQQDLKSLEQMGSENNFAGAEALFSSIEQRLGQLDLALGNYLKRRTG